MAYFSSETFNPLIEIFVRMMYNMLNNYMLCKKLPKKRV